MDRGIAQVSGAAPLDARLLNRWTNIVEARQAWCQFLGIPAICMVIPDRHVVCPDLLPPGRTVAEHRPVRQLEAALVPAARSGFLYPVRALAAGRAAGEVFPRGQPGWSRYGAYLGYRALVAALARQVKIVPVREGELAWPPDPMPGEAGGSVRVARALPRRIFTGGGVHVFAGGDPGLPRLVLAGDPAAMAMADPFLLAHASRAVLVEAHAFFPDLIRAEQPGLVVTVIAEHQLNDGEYVINELDRFPFTRVTGVKLPLPPG